MILYKSVCLSSPCFYHQQKQEVQPNDFKKDFLYFSIQEILVNNQILNVKKFLISIFFFKKSLSILRVTWTSLGELLFQDESIIWFCFLLYKNVFMYFFQQTEDGQTIVFSKTLYRRLQLLLLKFYKGQKWKVQKQMHEITMKTPIREILQLTS